jgi:cyclopropane-fatty-acyl-phospholipid synthase
MWSCSDHYDLSNEVFAAFLSWDMTYVSLWSSLIDNPLAPIFFRSYSCAVFDDEAKGPIGDLLEPRPIAPPRGTYLETRTIPADDLERGQLAKLHLIARRARITKGCRVLEIGFVSISTYPTVNYTDQHFSCGWGSFAILVSPHIIPLVLIWLGHDTRLPALTVLPLMRSRFQTNKRLRRMQILKLRA